LKYVHVFRRGVRVQTLLFEVLVLSAFFDVFKLDDLPCDEFLLSIGCG